MTTITASAVKDLREITGVAMMDCKKALVETNGDIEAAQDYLRKKGQAKALKKSARDTSEGAVCFATSADGKSAGLVKVACETDFVSRNERFQAFIKQLANQVCEKGAENLLTQPLVAGEGDDGSVLSHYIAQTHRISTYRWISVRQFELWCCIPWFYPYRSRHAPAG